MSGITRPRTTFRVTCITLFHRRNLSCEIRCLGCQDRRTEVPLGRIYRWRGASLCVQMSSPCRHLSNLEPDLCKVKNNLAKAREFVPVQVHWSFPGSMYGRGVKTRFYVKDSILFGSSFPRLKWLDPEAPGSTSPSFQPCQ